MLAGDRGVFNQGELDWGTRVLLENADVPPGAVLLDLGCGTRRHVGILEEHARAPIQLALVEHTAITGEHEIQLANLHT
ncbi:MAG: methyltransferase, partial [Actinomycetota bacterium]